MIYHPAIIILISVIALITFYKQKRIFSVIALLMPPIVALIFYTLPEKNTIEILNITLIYEGSDYNKLIGSAFILVLFSANLYALGQNKRLEIIFGSSYGACAFLCLLAGDFISMFIGLELMMIFSSIIIFIGGVRASLRSAKKYFLTHLMSSNLIIIGIAHLITQNNDLSFVPVAELLNNPEYSTTMLSIMLVGMLINIAAFPFSGWMVNYYPRASSAGFLYLISFTTKVSVMLLIKLFAGYEDLQYIAVIMIVYASIKAFSEDNLLSLLCYLSIMAMGLMLLGISRGDEVIIIATISYLFIHIIYKFLLSLSVATIIDKTGIDNCNKLQKIKSKTIIFGMIIGLATMVNVPIFSSFYIKSSISHFFSDTLFYFIIIFLSFMTVIVVPWKQYFLAKEYFDIKIKFVQKLNILFVGIVLTIFSVFGKYLPILSRINTFEELKLISQEPIKQIIIIIFAILLSIFWKNKRRITKAINLTETIGNIFFYIDSIWVKKKPKHLFFSEPLSISSLEKQTTKRVSLMHNQQVAIFIVFIIFLIMLIALLSRIS